MLTPFDESSPAFSSDGRFLANVSDESGRNEVYVQPYPGPGGRWLVSTAGGSDPVWSRDGRELFYCRGDELIAVAVTTMPAFSVGAPHRLLEGHYESSDTARNHDASPDGRRFVVIRSDEAASAQRFHLVLNWFPEVKRRAVSGR